MSKRGTYIGGSTVIGPGSDWFGRSEPKKTKKVKPKTAAAHKPGHSGKSPLDEAADRRRAEKKAAKAARQKNAEEAFEARMARKRRLMEEQRADPARAKRAASARQKIEDRMSGITVERRGKTGKETSGRRPKLRT